MQLSPTHLSSRLTRCTRLQPMVPAPLPGFAARSRALALAARAAKGFGKTKPAKKAGSDEDDGPAPAGRKGRRSRIQPNQLGPIPGQAQQGLPSGPDTTAAPQLLVPSQPAEEDNDFTARLAMLKEQARERASAAAAASSADLLSAPVAGLTPAIFDAPATPTADGVATARAAADPYANPPSVAQTLMNAAGAGPANSGISDPKLRDAAIGPSQLGLAAGALVFVACFVLVAAGDYAPSSKRYAGVRPAQSPPDPIEEKILRGKVSLYQDQLKADPSNDDATEALATTYARLQQYDKSAELLERLTKRNPDATEAWRLLGESSLLSQQPRKAVPAFERAVELRVAQAPSTPGALIQPDLQLLTGLVDAYVANADYAKAIESLRDVREKLKAASAAAAVAPPAAAAIATAPVAAEAAPEAAAAAALGAEPPSLTAPPLTGDEPAAASTSAATAAAEKAAAAVAAPPPGAAQRPLDPVGVELLTAKVFSAWRGHEQDALGTYDNLIKAFPEDYRGYLAKGVYLKEKGRKADAERMFLQARFYAPASRQQLVRAIADATPEAPLLPDNN
ncbi:hypothetical protein HYH03_017122 [Edaphochlamys debaryana]|uniref:Uncharacterized protein n=1 Tax=Edaphochlamys debaryana TaxID=47281 RepID=A0A836BPK6_9CHLO|nr:hypothetical protein HYH03_017122 [Edaphochlamys debaryana]|eukprot:KAG2484032.1 hypothetical protein HYH03_017122 [Edaphochlamys debaryana]